MDTPPASIPLTADLHHDGEQFVATCPEIPGATGKGSTDVEALMAMREAVGRYFEERAAKGEEPPPPEA